MQVHQMVASLSSGDAIGNESLHIQSILRSRGYVSEIFAESTDSAMAGRAKQLRDYSEFSSSNNVLIVHFSIGSSISIFTRKLTDKIVLLYHNITPPEWFVTYAPRVAKQCHQGRRELIEFATRADLVLGVSEYNRAELEAMGLEKAGVLPLLSSYEKLSDPPNSLVLRLYDDEKTNFLFVGRAIPNKRIEDLLKVFAIYQKHIDRNCRLLLVGDYLPIEKYHLALVQMVDKLRLENVVFTGHVKSDELVAYYQSADAYLSMSEHEGFCVPLLEAFHFEVPVIAYDAGAVGETMGGGGILVHQKNYEEIAELSYLSTEDSGFRQSVLDGQNQVLQDYASQKPDELLMQYVHQVASGRSV